MEQGTHFRDAQLRDEITAKLKILGYRLSFSRGGGGAVDDEVTAEVGQAWALLNRSQNFMFLLSRSHPGDFLIDF